MPESRLMDIRAATTYLGYPTEGALRMAISRGVIPSRTVVALGGRVKLDKKELDKFINRQKGRKNEQPPWLRRGGRVS